MINDLSQKYALNTMFFDQQTSNLSQGETIPVNPRAKTNQTSKRKGIRVGQRRESETNSAVNLVVMNTKASSTATGQYFFRGAASQNLSRRIRDNKTSHSLENVKAAEHLLNHDSIDLN
jgi:hypothetical protein